MTALKEYAGFWKLLYDWQTFITGMLALIATGVAACRRRDWVYN